MAEPTAIERAIDRMLKDPTASAVKKVRLRRILAEIEESRLADRGSSAAVDRQTQRQFGAARLRG